jgi:thiol-disulfide isomerase/thioredoxin
MKRVGIALALIVCCAVGCSTVPQAAQELVGKQTPEARLMLLDGEHVALRSKAGTNVAILFWATWCAHSRGAIADFEGLAERYAHRGDLEFYAVSVDKNDDFESLKNRIETQKLHALTHVFSGNDVQDEAFLGLRGTHIPYAVFIDSRGVVRFVGMGTGGLENFLDSKFRS